MGRRPRIILQGFPHHVVQRGHDRKAVFVEPADYQYYLNNLLVWKAHYAVGVLAYCLMTNHVHLLLVPHEAGQAVSGLMRRLSARQCRRVNRLEQRVGTLWSGRFKCSIVDTDAYLLACMRYIELNPVRAGMVAQAEDYTWSSYRQRMGLAEGKWLDADPITPSLGPTRVEQRAAYRDFVQAGIADKEYTTIRNAITRNQLTGDGRFVAEIERRTGQRIDTREEADLENNPGTFCPHECPHENNPGTFCPRHLLSRHLLSVVLLNRSQYRVPRIDARRSFC